MSQARPHFKWSELWCKGCDGNCAYSKDGKPASWISSRALDKLEDLRLSIGKPLIILSAARCPTHNARVGGAPLSQHRSTERLPSTAFDVTSVDVPLNTIASVAEAVGFGGIGRYNTFVHCDDRGHTARW
jgi:uncharacterized protein YcbK (DUF882 family)